MTDARPTEHAILMGGPCSGQTLEVYAGTTTITAYDPEGIPCPYVRTELVSDGDGDGTASYRVYRQEAGGH